MTDQQTVLEDFEEHAYKCGYKDGTQSERKRIVAWLREESTRTGVNTLQERFIMKDIADELEKQDE